MLVELLKTFTHELLSTTESFSAVTRARSKSHTTPNFLIRNVSRFSTNTKSESQVLTNALLSTTESFST